MSSNKSFRGGGGSSGGSEFTNTPDNLRSTDTFEGLMGMCVGPIKGPVNDLNSIRLDGSPIKDESGAENFPEFVAIYSTGDPALFPQKPILRLGSAAAPTNVGVSISNPNTGPGTATPGPWTARSIGNVGPNYIELRFIANQLFRQNDKGIYTTTATLEVQMKKTGTSTWINPTIGDLADWSGDGSNVGKTAGGIRGRSTNTSIDQSSGSNQRNLKITGKTSVPSVHEARIWVPNAGNYLNAVWDVRARLLERESYASGNNIEERQISWESIAAVYDETIGEEEEWRGVSWLQLYGKASDNLRGVPEVEVVAETKIVQVPAPAIFNPQTRVYTAGIWDGSWSLAYTNDPAWVIANAISDPIFGLAAFAPGAHLNKWDALEASKWFSTPVANGAGGFHPRSSLNVVHNQPMKGEDFIRYLAGAVGGLAYDDGSGEWRLKIDKPESAVDIFTLENIESEFSYAHTDVDTRFNDYRGTFLNEEFDFREESVQVFDSTSIALIGHKPTTLALIGCTSRQEALRRLKLRLRSSTNETHVVNFTTNRRADHLVPLDSILVADGDLGDMEARTTGRIIEVVTGRTHIKVRDPIRLEIGVSYTLKFAKPNAAYSPESLTDPTNTIWRQPTLVNSIALTNTSLQRGNVTDLYLATALPVDTAEYLVVALEATALTTLPRPYRIISIAKSDESERVQVSAVEIDAGKWDAADNISPQDSVFTDLSQIAPKPLPPTGGTMLALVTTPAVQGLNHSIIGNFVRPPGANVDGFRVLYNINGGADMVLTERTLVPAFDMVNPVFGTYIFKVHTITKTGVLSQPLTGTIIIDQVALTAADLAYANGATIESLRPAAYGADPTGSNIAAGIIGQGALATANLRGAWATLTLYYVGDIVTYAGGSKIVNTQHTSSMSFDSSKFFSLADPGANGLNNAAVFIYRRSATIPALPNASTTYTFATSVLTGLTNGWTTAVPAGTDPLFVSVATASSATATDTLADTEWSAATIMSGAGLSVGPVFLYKRAATLPAVPSTTSTFTFATAVLTGHNNGWTQTIPSGTDTLYVTTATAVGTGTTDTIATGEWAAVNVMAVSGNYTEYRFIRSIATPATPTGDSPATWSITPPTGTETLWMTRGTKNASGVLQGLWSTPVSLAGNTFRGAYDAATSYYLNNTVTSNGGTYFALLDNFSAQTPSGTGNATAYWGVVAAPGVAGTPGTPPSAFSATINLASGAAVNLRTAANAAGYTGASDATVTFKVPNAVVCRGLSSGYGIDTGVWPAGYAMALTLIVESGGIVDGGGGNGGGGGSGGGGGGGGSVGGDAIYLQVNMTGGITINAGGTVRSGGTGGGGGSNGQTSNASENQVRGGGGGGGGAPNGSAGAGAVTDFYSGSAGSAGTTAGGGAGGAANNGGPSGTGSDTAMAGGAGATYGSGAAVRKAGKTAVVTNNGTMTGAVVA